MAKKTEIEGRLGHVLDVIDMLPVSEWKKLVDVVLLRTAAEALSEIPGQAPPGFKEFLRDYCELKQLLRTVGTAGVDVYSRAFWRQLASAEFAVMLAPFGMQQHAQLVADYLLSEILQEMTRRSESRAEELNDSGYDLHGSQWERAITLHDRAISTDRLYPIAWINKGIALKNLERIDEAIACYDEVIDHIDAEHKKAWYNKGNALWTRFVAHAMGTHPMSPEQAQRDANIAVHCFQQALTIDPKYESAVTALANCEKARQMGLFLTEQTTPLVPAASLNGPAHRRVSATNADYGAAQVDRFAPWAESYFQAIDADRRGRLSEAILHITEAVAKGGAESVNVLHSQGLILSKLGDKRKALDTWRQALTLAPSHIEVLFAIGSTLNELDQFGEAIGILQKLVSVNPSYYKAWNSLGYANVNQGKVNEARECYQNAIKCNSNSEVAKNALQLLSRLH